MVSVLKESTSNVIGRLVLKRLAEDSKMRVQYLPTGSTIVRCLLDWLERLGLSRSETQIHFPPGRSNSLLLLDVRVGIRNCNEARGTRLGYKAFYLNKAQLIAALSVTISSIFVLSLTFFLIPLYPPPSSFYSSTIIRWHSPKTFPRTLPSEHPSTSSD